LIKTKNKMNKNNNNNSDNDTDSIFENNDHDDDDNITVTDKRDDNNDNNDNNNEAETCQSTFYRTKQCFLVIREFLREVPNAHSLSCTKNRNNCCICNCMSTNLIRNSLQEQMHTAIRVLVIFNLVI
jgi:hypothetical protein